MNEILEAFETDEYRDYCASMLNFFPQASSPCLEASQDMFRQVNSALTNNSGKMNFERPKHRDAIRIAAILYWIGGEPTLSIQFLNDLVPQKHDLDSRVKRYISNLINPSDSEKLDYLLIQGCAFATSQDKIFNQISYMIWLRDFGHFRLPLGFQTFLEKIGDDI